MLAPILQSHRPVPTKSGETLSAALKSRSWCAYLIISTRPPIKTYVGVTTDFSRRLKQHNGEIKGGAKASRAGRPWICACIIHGFKDQSEACAFETKWKRVSKQLPYRRKKMESEGEELDDISLQLLQRRHQALDKVEGSFDCSCLKFDWKRNPL